MPKNDISFIDSFIVGDWYIDYNYGLKRLLKYEAGIQLGKTKEHAGLFDEMREMSKPKTGFFEMKYNKKKYKGKRIKFQDVMVSDDNLCMVGIDSLIDELKSAYSDNSVDGILLEMNTGGGEVEAAIRAKSALDIKNKPVVIWSSMFASGGVYASLGADLRVGNGSMSQFGSIGVMVSISKDQLKYIREKVLTIYSDKSKNKNKEFRALLEEGELKGPMQERLTKLDDAFMQDVDNHLNLNQSLKEETLSGAMFTAKDAKRRGLIDAIGSEDFAIRSLARLINANN